MNLIDRQNLLEELEWLHGVVNRCNRPSIKELIDRVKAQPTVAPKKGEWINERVQVVGMFAEYCVDCSACGCSTGYSRYPWSAYCPNCGADMRGSESV